VQSKSTIRLAAGDLCLSLTSGTASDYDRNRDSCTSFAVRDSRR